MIRLKEKSYLFFMKKKEIILGVDPGTRITGYGVLVVEAGAVSVLDFGCIKPPPSFAIPQKYLIIFEGIESLIKKFSPNHISVETQFLYKNVQSAFKIGMARGSVLIAGAKYNVPIHEYAPTKAKQAATGNGSASKEQVQKMMQKLLGLQELPTPEDAADALALAYCHANQLQFSSKIKGCAHV